MTTREIQRHWDAVAKLGCMVTGSRWDVTLHHAHGGSMKDRGIHRAFGRKTSPYLVMPLVRELHVGRQGIDVIGVEVWESMFGTQAEFLDLIAQKLGVDVWAKALEELKPIPRRAA